MTVGKTVVSANFRGMVSKFFFSIPGFAIALAGIDYFTPARTVVLTHPIAMLAFISVCVCSLMRIHLWTQWKTSCNRVFPSSADARAHFTKFAKQVRAYGYYGGLTWAFLGITLVHYIGPFNNDSIMVYMILIIWGVMGVPLYAESRSALAFYVFSMCAAPAAYSIYVDPHLYLVPGCILLFYSVILYSSTRRESGDSLEVEKESALQKIQLENYSAVISAVPGLVTIFDQNLCYSVVNKAVTGHLGMDAKDIVGKPLGFQASSEFQRTVREFKASNALTSQAKMQIGGIRGMRWYVASLSKMPDQRIIVVSIDVDDHMKAEDAVAEQRSVAEGAAQMAAVGELAAGIAHEINNPIAVITSKSEQTIRKMQQKGQLDFVADLEKIRNTGFRIANIVRGLKNLSRNSDADPFVDARFSDIAKDVMAVMDEKFRSNQITLQMQIPESLIAPCRPTQIGQVILNLASNSFDELQGKADSWVRIEGKDCGGEIELAVVDSGPGLPEHVQKKLMTPFFTTKAAGVGTGLGLSISKRIAVDHGGDFYLDTKSPNTRFVLRIPKLRVAIKAA